MAARRRLDAELVRRELAPSRDAAKRLIEEGRVLVGGAPATKASRQVDPGEDVKVRGDPPRFVSRAGEKLAGALERSPLFPLRFAKTSATLMERGSSGINRATV